MRRLFDWLDVRTGYRVALKHFTDRPIRGGPRWAYVYGWTLAALFVIQAVTGITLATYYSPSTTDAWASVNYIQNEISLGWFLRGMHHYGASAVVIVLACHVLQSVWFASYRAPRELNWLTGVVLLQVVLGFALTGYLLPWDQRGWAATTITTSIAGTAPVIGPWAQTLMMGGPVLGNLTLTRFFAAHVFLLPVALSAFLFLHVKLARRHGNTVPPTVTEAQADAATQAFFPSQLVRNLAFLGIVLMCVAVYVVKGHGAPLGPPADPSANLLARPEWYFLPLFQLLKYFEGDAEVVGTIFIPGLAMTLLAALPFLHARLVRVQARIDRVFTVGVFAGFAGLLTLGALAIAEDLRSKEVAEMALLSDKASAEAQRLAKSGVPVTGPLDLFKNDPVVWGERVFTESCATCHSDCAEVPFKGSPCLVGYASRAWLAAVTRSPRHPLFFGTTKIDEMDDYKGDDVSLRALTEFMYGQGARPDTDPVLALTGKKLFETEGCESCHTLDGTGNGSAPDFRGYATADWLESFIRTPEAERFYGKGNEMDAFDHKKLPDRELQAVIAYLRAQATVPLHPALKIP